MGKYGLGVRVVLGTFFALLSTLGVAQQTKFRNCSEMNRVYPHGVGRVGAKDKTSGTPVTTFARNNALYDAIFRNRPSLDRDRDGIACERR